MYAVRVGLFDECMHVYPALLPITVYVKRSIVMVSRGDVKYSGVLHQGGSGK
jgi:hypothetical protein